MPKNATASVEALYLLDRKPDRLVRTNMVNHSNFTDRTALRWRRFILVSALSSNVERVLSFQAIDGYGELGFDSGEAA